MIVLMKMVKIFTRDELIERGYPDGTSYCGVMIHDIDDALDIFFKGDMNTWLEC